MTWEIENSTGTKITCGVDEAGRGPLAGDVFAAAVILPNGYIPHGLDDSKKLSAAKRAELYKIIKAEAVAYAVSTASVAEIDDLNILNASMLAMNRAVAALAISPDFVLIDGTIARGFSIPHLCVPKGDSRSPNIAAASILAKVERDEYMKRLHEIYPQYDFARHKGYPTVLHYAKIREFGISPVHRKTFLKGKK